jgi:hypothetical protein
VKLDPNELSKITEENRIRVELEEQQAKVEKQKQAELERQATERAKEEAFQKEIANLERRIKEFAEEGRNSIRIKEFSYWEVEFSGLFGSKPIPRSPLYRKIYHHFREAGFKVELKKHSNHATTWVEMYIEW